MLLAATAPFHVPNLDYHALAPEIVVTATLVVVLVAKLTDKDGTDSIAIRSVVHLTLGYDHRLIDGAVADQFMAQVKKNLETWTEEVG